VLWVLLAHIILPLLFGIIFMLFSVASSPTVPTWDVAIETALDLAILGIGATAAIFENPILVQVFKEHAAEVGIAIVAIDLLFAAFIVLIRRYIFPTTDHQLRWGVAAMTLGALAIVATSSILAYSYRVAGPLTVIPPK
jgi:hypothetical protein